MDEFTIPKLTIPPISCQASPLPFRKLQNQFQFRSPYAPVQVRQSDRCLFPSSGQAPNRPDGSGFQYSIPHPRHPVAKDVKIYPERMFPTRFATKRSKSPPPERRNHKTGLCRISTRVFGSVPNPAPFSFVKTHNDQYWRYLAQAFIVFKRLAVDDKTIK